jgi:hypothetical protein
MSRLTTKDRKEQRRGAIRLSLIDDHLIATGQVALRGGVLDNLIELTAEQLILRRSPIVRKELAKFTTAKKNRSNQRSSYTGHARKQQRDC